MNSSLLLFRRSAGSGERARLAAWLCGLWLTVLALAPLGASAQISVLGSPVNQADFSSNLTIVMPNVPIPAGTNRMLILITQRIATGDTFSATVDGVTMTFKAGMQGTGAYANNFVFYQYYPLGTSTTATTSTISNSFTASGTTYLTAIVLQNVNQTVPGPGTNQTYSYSKNVFQPSVSGQMVIDSILNPTLVGSPSTPALGSSQTLVGFNSTMGVGVSYAVHPPGALTWNVASENVGVHAAVVVQPFGSGNLPSTTANGTTYIQSITVTGGTGTPTFALTAGGGALPPNFTLSSGGVISGSPGAAGTFTFSVTATDALAANTSQSFRLLIVGFATVSNPTSTAITSTSATLGGNVTNTGGDTIISRGVVYSVTGTNPNPIFQVPSNGVSSATSSSSTDPFTVNVTGLTANTQYSYKAYATNSTGVAYSPIGTFTTAALVPVAITTTTLPTPVIGTAYSQTLAATGGTAPYTFSVGSGTLPPGLTLSTAGVLSGTPTTAGTSAFTLGAKDTLNATATQNYTLTIASAVPVAIATTTLPNPTIGAVYNQTLAATGGTAPYIFLLAMTSGPLPPGLTLSTSGVLSGTPTTAGSYQFLVGVADQTLSGTSQSYTLTVGAAAPLAITTTTLPVAGPGLNYSFTIATTGGTGLVTFAVLTGTLPPGLTLTLAGTLSGTATTPGVSTFTIAAVDSLGVIASQVYTFYASSALAFTGAATLPAATQNAAYNQTLATSGATAGSLIFASGALPAGLTLSRSTGTISGTPTTAGTYTFLANVTDTSSTTAARTFTLVVNAAAPLTAQTITFAALPNKITTDAPITLAATASSGLPVSFAVSGPAALSGATLTLAGTPGTVTVTASQAGNTTFAAATSVVQSFTVTAPPAAPDPGRLKNLSVFTPLQAGEKLTFGFVVGGAGTTGSPPLLVRAGGPALAQFGIGGLLADPKMELFNGTTSIATNDNWASTDPATLAAQAATGAFAFPAGSLDAVINLSSAPAGNLSAAITGPTGASGIVIAEVYDATAAAAFTATTPRLVNVSVLKSIGTGFTMGFVLTGSTNTKVLIRAVGPTLTSLLGVGGTAPDPAMTLYNGASQIIAGNDNWETPVGTGAATAAQITAATAQVAFPLALGGKDAAIFTTLAPGNYTVTVNATGADGLCLVEVYEVP